MHYIKKYGVDEHLRRLNITDKCAYLNSLRGRVAFVLQTLPNDMEFIEYKTILKSIKWVYNVNIARRKVRRAKFFIATILENLYLSLTYQSSDWTHRSFWNPAYPAWCAEHRRFYSFKQIGDLFYCKRLFHAKRFIYHGVDKLPITWYNRTKVPYCVWLYIEYNNWQKQRTTI